MLEDVKLAFLEIFTNSASKEYNRNKEKHSVYRILFSYILNNKDIDKIGALYL